MTAEADAPLRLGISACLIGEAVRFDGGHKRDFFLVKTLGPIVEWVPVCPELESGLGVPRESMRLVQIDRKIRLVTGKPRAIRPTPWAGTPCESSRRSPSRVCAVSC